MILMRYFIRLLGKFEEASHDLCESLKIDYDDQTNEWLNEVKPNAEKLRQHRLGAQRKKEEREVSSINMVTKRKIGASKRFSLNTANSYVTSFNKSMLV